MPRSWPVKLHSRLTNSVIIHQADNYSPTLETGSLKCLMLRANRGPEKCRPRSLNINTCGIKGRLRKRERELGEKKEWERANERGTNCSTRAFCSRLMQENIFIWVHKFVCLI